jgi:hypothetical protein
MTRARRDGGAGEQDGAGASGDEHARDAGRSSGRAPVALLAAGTGAIGRAPRALAASGYRFLLLAKSEAQARATEGAWIEAGAEAVGFVADVLRDGALAEALERGRAAFGCVPSAVVWNVGFVPWPIARDWDPALLARVARDEVRALGGLAAALAAAWRGAGGRLVTIEGHGQERVARGAPVLAVAGAIRAGLIERLRADVAGLEHTRVVLGACPSGAAGEGRWLGQDEIADAVAEALAGGRAEVVAGDIDLAERLAERFRAPSPAGGAAAGRGGA